MKTTGYALRDAMKEHELVKELAQSAFNDSLKKFEGEEKEAPAAVLARYEGAEKALAALEVAQVKYNLAVKVSANSESMTLLEAIKLVGILGRFEKTCKSAVADPVRLPSYMDSDEKDPTKVRAKRTLSAEDAVAMTKAYGKQARALRAAIAAANAVEVDIEGLDPALFEG